MFDSVFRIFACCAAAMGKGEMITRISRQDKEFHFQNWFRSRLEDTGLNFEVGGRNSYPDFRMVSSTEGYEIKGLAYPGREANYDCNSQVPTGFHNGRIIYYVFGRYPSDPDGDQYPVLDLVICHGDFLNANHDYVHKNRSVRGFGSYGDIAIRDRKMYVAPTPFGLTDGTAHQRTLILPQDFATPKGFFRAGEMTRVEADELVIGYRFDLLTNELTAEMVPNPGAGRQHHFRAWRMQGDPQTAVAMRQRVAPAQSEEQSDDNGRD